MSKQRPLKVYWCGPDGTTHRMVAARNQKEAARLMDVTLHCLSTYGSITSNEDDIAIATVEPGVVFTKPMNRFLASWESWPMPVPTGGGGGP